jgi:drug/metabolite transporter (DMT)-like permease
MRRPDLAATAFVLIWSSGYVVGSVASKAAAPVAITTWRLGLAGDVLALLARAAHVRRPSGRVVARVAGVGVVMFGVQFGFLYLAMGEGMPAGTAALLMSICPLVVAALSAAFGVERLRAPQWLGVALGEVGVVLALADRVSAPPALAPVAWTLIGLAGFAAGTLLQRRLPGELDFRVLASIECGAAGLALIPWAVLHGGLAVPLTAPALLSLSWLTLVCAVGGPLALFSLIRSRGATRASSLLFLVPAVTALVSWPALGQPFGLNTVLGLVVAAVGVRLLTGSLLDWRSEPSSAVRRPRRDARGRVAAPVPARTGGR